MKPGEHKTVQAHDCSPDEKKRQQDFSNSSVFRPDIPALTTADIQNWDDTWKVLREFLLPFSPFSNNINYFLCSNIRFNRWNI